MGKKKRRDPNQFEKIVKELKSLGKAPVNDDNLPVTVRCDVDPKKLVKHQNKLNWKDHTKRQLDYISVSIQDAGWARNILYCANTDRIIDGHGRLKKALDNNYTTVPVDIGWWTEEQGNTLLASLDNMSNMASVDANALSSLTEHILKSKKSKKTKESKLDYVTNILTDIHDHAKKISKKEKDRITIRKSPKTIQSILGKKESKKDKKVTQSDNREMYIRELREDIIFPCKGNIYGVPDLLPNKLYTDTSFLPEDTFDRSGRSLKPEHYYCHNSRPFDSQHHLKPSGGFLGFFCEDEKFNAVYNHPSRFVERLIDEQWTAVVEPDFSAYEGWPFALCLWSIYRARWCARYWQQLGVHIIPQIHRSDDIEADKWLYDSLPNPTPIGMMQIRMGGQTLKSDEDYWNNIGVVLDYCYNNIGLEVILIYGRPEMEVYVVGQMPIGLKYRMVTPFIDKRKKIIKEKKNGK